MASPRVTQPGIATAVEPSAAPLPPGPVKDMGVTRRGPSSAGEMLWASASSASAARGLAAVGKCDAKAAMAGVSAGRARRAATRHTSRA